MRKKISKVFLFLFLLNLYAVTQAFSSEGGQNGPSRAYKSRCNADVDPSFAKEVIELGPWLRKVETTLKEQSDYGELTKAFLSDSRIDTVSCCFKVTKNGDLIQPAILGSSGSSNFDRKLLNFIKNSKSFPVPANQRPSLHGVEILIIKYQKHVFIGASLRPLSF